MSCFLRTMGGSDRNSDAAGRHRPAGDLIAAVLANMRCHLERLKYSTLAPSRYLVYIHPSEYARLEGILPILQDETIRALADEVGRLNRRTGLRRYTGRLLGEPAPPIQSASGDWHVEFLADAEGVVGEDDILVDSELLLPAAPELGVGESTRRITTLRSGQRTTTRETTTGAGSAGPAVRAFARLVYEDSSGHHAYDIVKDSVTIGRGGVTYPVDVKIAASVDVSREHARIRRDPESGRFFLIDLSSLGTTLNGRHVPQGHVETGGTKRENGVDTLLPDRARIGLAETVFLDFSVVRG